MSNCMKQLFPLPYGWPNVVADSIGFQANLYEQAPLMFAHFPLPAASISQISLPFCPAGNKLHPLCFFKAVKWFHLQRFWYVTITSIKPLKKGRCLSQTNLAPEETFIREKYAFRNFASLKDNQECINKVTYLIAGTSASWCAFDVLPEPMVAAVNCRCNTAAKPRCLYNVYQLCVDWSWSHTLADATALDEHMIATDTKMSRKVINNIMYELYSRITISTLNTKGRLRSMWRFL